MLTPPSNEGSSNQRLPPPPGIPNTNQAGIAIKEHVLEDSFIDEKTRTDSTENMACRNCGILFGDLDSLQKHIFNNCASDEKERSQVPSTEPSAKKQKLCDAFDVDIQDDRVFSKMFDDAKELNKDKMEEIRQKQKL